MLKDYLNYNNNNNNNKCHLVAQAHRIIIRLEYNNNIKNSFAKYINKYINKRKLPPNFKIK